MVNSIPHAARSQATPYPSWGSGSSSTYRTSSSSLYRTSVNSKPAPLPRRSSLPKLHGITAFRHTVSCYDVVRQGAGSQAVSHSSGDRQRVDLARAQSGRISTRVGDRLSNAEATSLRSSASFNDLLCMGFAPSQGPASLMPAVPKCKGPSRALGAVSHTLQRVLQPSVSGDQAWCCSQVAPNSAQVLTLL